MCVECKALATADWFVGHPALAAGLIVTALLVVAVPIWVVRR